MKKKTEKKDEFGWGKCRSCGVQKVRFTHMRDKIVCNNHMCTNFWRNKL
jgi:ribosomal protein S27E